MRTSRRSVSLLLLILLLTAALAGAGTPASASDPLDPVYDLDHPCNIVAEEPVRSGTRTATGTGTFNCPNPHKHMTIIVCIEVFTSVNGNQTQGCDETTFGEAPSTFVVGETTQVVCIAGALTMKTTATGWWENSKGEIKGFDHDESLSVPVVCAAQSP